MYAKRAAIRGLQQTTAVPSWAQQDQDTFVAYEMCDAVEEETFAIDGVNMSNFVYPSYFEPWHKTGSTTFDFLMKLVNPFQIAPGGYSIIFKNGTVSEIFGSKAKEKRFAEEDRTHHRSEYRKSK